jgi:hypothetical protein
LHSPQDERNAAPRRDTSNQLTAILVINGVVVLLLIVLAISVPSASEWISAAAQAEFANPDLPTLAPTQMAQPAEQIRVVRSN